jgi:hypothetical protein
LTVRLKSRVPILIELEDGQILRFSAKRIPKFKEASALKARYRAARNAEEQDAGQLFEELFADSFRRYLRIDEPIISERDDGTEIAISDPGELVEELAGRQDILARIFYVILTQIELNPGQKKVSPLPGDSSPSSEEPAMAQAGEKLETTVTSAGNGDSASNGDAPALLETSQSGSTDGEMTAPSSSSTPVPFVF